MSIEFLINFAATPGDRMFLIMDIGRPCVQRNEIAMSESGGERWKAIVEIQAGKDISYCFQVRCANGQILHEAGCPRRFVAGTEDIRIHCSWQGYDTSAPLLTDAFTKIFFPHPIDAPVPQDCCRHAVITVTAPAIQAGKSVFICGACDVLGKWDTAKALKMKPCGGARWAAGVPVRKQGERLVFKFIMKSVTSGEDEDILWEEGCDRILEAAPGHIYEYSSAAFTGMPPRFAGTAVPVFSLRDDEGYGIGDFSCMKKMADWLHATGQKILQILPVNDTLATFTWADSYPYNAISSVALNPAYLNPSLVGELPENDETRGLELRRKALDMSESVDFEKAVALKNDYIRLLYGCFSRKTFASGDFKAYFKENGDWLLPYSAFCTLRDEYRTADFRKWGEWAEYGAGTAEKMWSTARFRKRMKVYIFTQYHLHRQLSDAVTYAASRGIAVMGDIPIGISPCSVEAWTMPSLFNMDFSAGAPPDYFSRDGQNWGFPTYNWERMAEDGYAWWKFRLRKMAEYFSMYRIDHILGFFRIWEIPRSVTSGMYGHFYPALPYSSTELASLGFEDSVTDVGLFIEDPRKAGHYHPCINGTDTPSFKSLDSSRKESYRRLHDDFFYRRHNGFWKDGAMLKLSELVAATGMTPCAEDLGMIPDCVPQVLDNLKIATLEIQRMPKAPFTEFADPASYPYLSVCSTGTHDVSTLRGWWEEDRARTQRYYSGMLHMSGPAPSSLTPEICRAIIKAHLRSPSAFAVLPVQDWLALSVQADPSDPREEQINNPADPRHHWKYRMPASPEMLTDEIRRLVEESGR